MRPLSRSSVSFLRRASGSPAGVPVAAHIPITMTRPAPATLAARDGTRRGWGGGPGRPLWSFRAPLGTNPVRTIVEHALSVVVRQNLLGQEAMASAIRASRSSAPERKAISRASSAHAEVQQAQVEGLALAGHELLPDHRQAVHVTPEAGDGRAIVSDGHLEAGNSARVFLCNRRLDSGSSARQVASV